MTLTSDECVAVLPDFRIDEGVSESKAASNSIANAVERFSAAEDEPAAVKKMVVQRLDRRPARVSRSK